MCVCVYWGGLMPPAVLVHTSNQLPTTFATLRLTQLECVRFITVGPLADEILALCTLTRLKHLEIRWVDP